MKFIHALLPILTVGILVSFSSSSEASEKLKVFACSTCSSEAHMLAIARKEAPELECHWSNLSGSTSKSGDQVCHATTRVFAVANSLSRTAKKYEVTSSPSGHDDKKISIKTVSLSSKELSSLNEFYDIDGPFRKLPNLSIQIPVSDHTIFDLVNVADGSDGQISSKCQSHPLSFLTRKGENRAFNELKHKIAAKLDNQKWVDAWEDTDLTGVGLELTGASVSFSHQQQVFQSITFDTDPNNNKLLYEVSHHGEEPPFNGQRRLSLDFKLLPGPSWIDGHNLGSLFHEVRPYTDLRKDLVSHCLLAFLESFEVNQQTFAPGANPFTDKPITNPSGGGGFGGICTRRVVAYVGNRRQAFYFSILC